MRIKIWNLYISRMARQARKELADLRALTEQAERENVIDPRDVTTEELLSGGSHMGSRMVGGGLSMANDFKKALGRGRSAKASHAREGKALREAQMAHEEEGRAMEGGSHHDAHAMGQHLQAHLASLHGGAYAKHFVKGMMDGGGFWSDFADGFKKGFANTANALSFIPGVNVLANATEGWRGSIPGLGGGNISHTGQYEGEGTKKGQRRKTARKAYEGEPHEFHEAEGGSSGSEMREAIKRYKEMKSRPEGTGRHCVEGGTGAGATPSMGLSQVRGGFRINPVTGLMGNLVDKIQGHGGAKQKKPLMEGDGRKKRAEIVKRVMREKGCSMIEASKFVKAHGLY